MSKLSYRHKTVLMILLLVVLGWQLYKKVFASTVIMVQNTSVLEDKLNNSEGSAATVDLKAEMRRYEALKIHSDTMPDPAGELLNLLSVGGVTLNIGVAKLEPENTEELKGYVLHSISVNVKGDYHSLVKLTRILEKKLQYSCLSAVRYYTVEDRSTAETELYEEIQVRYLTRT